MHCDPREPEKRLWRNLSRSQLGGFKFRRQAVTGSYFADFLCPAKVLIVEVDGVLPTILDALNTAANRWTGRPHPNPSPEGERLNAPSRKL
jgi:very-short-patch-repair endonuclease